MRTIAALIIAFLFSISTMAQTTKCACCTENHTEFDFWIGTWEVTNPNGTKAGENKIEKTQGNCVLTENWTSATSGYTGTSNNFYNSKAKQWEQIWVDNTGGILHLKGHKIGNQMILQTDKELNSEGKTYFHRVTWTDNDDGSVRQLWEIITEGKDIIIAFDGLYKRVN
jgi:hypothetical protein